MAANRRESTRIVSDRPLLARADGVDVDLGVLDVSFGGFRVQSQTAFDPSTTHHFQIATPTGRVIQLRATAVYSRRPVEALPMYETGFRFLGTTDPGTQANIRALIEVLMLVLQGD